MGLEAKALVVVVRMEWKCNIEKCSEVPLFGLRHFSPNHFTPALRIENQPPFQRAWFQLQVSSTQGKCVGSSILPTTTIFFGLYAYNVVFKCHYGHKPPQFRSLQNGVEKELDGAEDGNMEGNPTRDKG